MKRQKENDKILISISVEKVIFFVSTASFDNWILQETRESIAAAI